MHPIVDTHCHLDFPVFDSDRDAVLDACAKNHVTDLVIPAVSQPTWRKTIALCHEHSNLHLALGLHPLFVEQHEPQHLNELDQLITQHNGDTSKNVVAVGEIGLDFYLKHLDQEKQTVFFTKQLIIANQHSLPVIIHNRKAHDRCLSLLKEIPVVGGIIHNFNGSIQQAHKYIELGFKLGFGGMLTFQRSRVIRALAKQIPIESIVLETDAPDLTVEAHKGHRNSPEYLPHVLAALAEVKELSRAEVALKTSLNAKSALNL
ncbi:TatD family hydrolase [Arenicella sp. 4NH20-0111]|uniref:TatD family hydrolase n=1 Tax=Arenicella sp. 4NH20-0111 TaxID=3127648 RepID=UPI003108C094